MKISRIKQLLKSLILHLYALKFWVETLSKTSCLVAAQFFGIWNKGGGIHF